VPPPISVSADSVIARQTAIGALAATHVGLTVARWLLLLAAWGLDTRPSSPVFSCLRCGLALIVGMQICVAPGCVQHYARRARLCVGRPGRRALAGDRGEFRVYFVLACSATRKNRCQNVQGWRAGCGMLYAGRYVRGKQSEGLRQSASVCANTHSRPWTAQDPAASCVGVQEVQEAFRALKALKPEHLAAPKAIPGEEPGSTRVALNQRYLGGLQVRLTICAVADICTCDGAICSKQAPHSVCSVGGWLASPCVGKVYCLTLAFWLSYAHTAGERTRHTYVA